MPSCATTWRSIPTAGLDTARRHDALLADGFLELQIMEAGLPQFHRGNPAVYTGEGVFCHSLPLSARRGAVRRAGGGGDRSHAGAAGIPGPGSEPMSPARPCAWTEQALREARAAAAYFGDGSASARRGTRDCGSSVPGGSGRRPRSVPRARGLAGRDAAHAARNLTSPVAARPSTAIWPAGISCPPTHDASWLENYASAALARRREELEARAAELDPARSWQEQLADLPDHHPSVDDYYAAFPRVWNAAREAAIDADLVDLAGFPDRLRARAGL